MFLALVKRSLEHVFSLGLTMKASEPKGLIYATMGLIRPGDAGPMVPDYSQGDRKIRYGRAQF